MEYVVKMLISGFENFLLVFVRMTGLFIISPVFGRRNIPAYLKIGFSFLLALILVNTVSTGSVAEYGNILGFFLLTAKEFLVGTALGFISYVVFSAIYIAGQLIDMQIGFGMVNVLDPMSNIQIPVTANFYFITSMLVFLAVNGHHMLIRALFESYRLVPLGKAVFDATVTDNIIRMFGELFFVGFKIAAPVTASILITDVALGIISKTIPQINVFVVGMPFKIVMGIAVMMITIPMFIIVLEALFNGMESEMLRFLTGQGG